MIDPILSLAHSIQSNKGVFAVLVGSGLSRSAGIPTGWEVTLDLVRQLAAMQGEDPTTDPEAWYADRYGQAPGYSALLDALAKTPSERRAILHSFFEPTDDEREQGLKLPTRAHRAIADLVAKGYIRVIVTTNFDRLMEMALQDVGITPVVISTADATRGAAPLVHQRCVVVKVHGDYLDDRIKNTEDELATYDPALDAYLDRVFDEFGLIVCGWSGEWDPALRAAIERCPTRRYTTFWTGMRASGPLATKLIQVRNAQVIDITGADDFFEKLLDKVTSLEEMRAPGPLSAGAAVASVKRYIAEPRYKIRFDDLLADEVERIRKRHATEMPASSQPVDKETIRKRFHAYDSSTEVLRHMLFSAARWAEAYHYESIRRAIFTLAPPNARNGINVWLSMMAYPASLAFFAACAGADAGQNYRLLDSLFRATFRFSGREHQAIPEFCAAVVIDKDCAQALHQQDRHTPMSDHLAAVITPMLTGIAVEPDSAFDRLEVLMALAHFDHQTDPATTSWMPHGRFAWRHYESAYGAVFEEAERMGADWAPLKAGMFQGKVARFDAVKEAFMTKLKAAGSRY
uniref:SIR2 family protein n=1 Tax=Bosea sp. NBC_00436 TaxID=2969620 RepID=A0A9E8CN93_9HYPH